MSVAAQTWFDDAFFKEGTEESLDGGATSHGALWHAISPRWGHSMHTMCSYHGMFPARLAHYFIQRFSPMGGLVEDPFSGRGTTVLQARVEGRRTVGNDLSPLAYVLSKAKAAPPSWPAVIGAVDELERRYRVDRAHSVDAPADIEMLYHPNTLAQLVYLRSHLLRRPIGAWSREELMIAGAMAGILHGAHRKDGTSQFLSISMPNTFSMSPAYVRRYIADNGLVQIDQNVFDCLRNKLARLYLDAIPGSPGKVTKQDANNLLPAGTVTEGSVDLVLTSPPYLGVVNYGTSNWIRLWWLGLDEVARDGGVGRRRLNAKLDHQHGYDSYLKFMQRTLVHTRLVLKKSGVAVFVIGDVALPGESSLPLAEAVWDDVGSATGLQLVDIIDDSLPVNNKVSRIWGETRGRATDRDRALVLARTDADDIVDRRKVDWDEPYKEAGPDAAHALLQGRR